MKKEGYAHPCTPPAVESSATARGEYLTFVGIFLAGAAFRFYQIGVESIWIDEYHSITLALSGGPLQIVRAAAADVHPPLYFLLLRLWLDLFSDSLAWARGFSAVVSLLALIPLWRLARRLAGPTAALLAAALLALSPYQLWYAQETRMYALLVLAEVSLFYFLVAFLSPERSSPRRRAFLCAGLFLCSAAVIFTHFYFVFLLTFVALYWVLSLREARPVRPGPWLLFGLWCAWCAAWALTGLLQMTERLQSGFGIDWVPPLSRTTVLGILGSFTYGIKIPPSPRWILTALVAAYAVALAAACVKPRAAAEGGVRAVDPRAALLLMLGCTFALPLLVSIARPVVYYGQRYLIVATIPFYLAVALGLARLKEMFGRYAWLPLFAIYLAGIARYAVDYFDSRQKRGFDTAAELLDERYRPGDMILVLPDYSAGCLRYYLTEPFIAAPRDAGAIAARLNEDPERTIWFVDIGSLASRLEVEVSAAAVPAGQSIILESSDLPGQLLRLTPYRAAAPP